MQLWRRLLWEGLLQQKRALNGLFRVNKRDAESMRQLLGIGKAEHLIGTFPVKAFAQHGVHVRENQIHRVLSKIVKGTSAGNNAPEKRMVVFHVRLLVGSVGIAEEDGGFLVSAKIILKSGNTAEFAAVIRQQHRKHFAEAKP